MSLLNLFVVLYCIVKVISKYYTTRMYNIEDSRGPQTFFRVLHT